ncbi:MAG: ABC transporter substrate-binding protein [Anaerolineaceae bacterium]|nr:peptide ABC transporter substrate-binding protein [Anaerolineae bacterium]MBL1172554.1 peptide ABC transporter substrate-binding protein [Chloroflexota bacterium]MDL1925372.1 peptide ABC transporter substrate-binding protein [Anaerolineae bacterium AMX1]WKZ54091.1 MAG: peptide ABC transporter substrate-binding protein [Anaerolineales bacterium]GJQ40333.1 MAG: ABC transporter substrate-binding protein [Anaerolineaceae bacterium]
MSASKIWIGIVIGILTFSLPGCQAGNQPPAGGGAADQSAVVIVVAEEPPSFNPVITDAGYDSLVMELVMLGLTDIDAQGNVFPELAAELPTEENGGVTIDPEAGTMDVTWKMRQDVKWSDGTPVTADDALFTLAAIQDPDTGTWIPGVDYIDSVDKVDDYAFTIHYNGIFPGYLTQLGGEQVVVWPAHYCDASQGFSAWDCSREPLSNGPYILKDWMAGDHLTFVRNENYYVKGKPAIDRVIVRVVPDREVRKTMLLKGDADLDMWTTEPVIEDLKDAPNVKVSISPENRWVMRIFFNLAAKGTTDPAASPHPILSDLRVRRAIRMAIDVDAISKEFYFGYAQPVWTEFFRPPYACNNIPRPVFDPAAAAALLEAAGWTDTDGDGVRECHGCKTAEEGYKMEMEFITYSEFGEALELTQQLIAEMLGRIGVKLNLSVVEGSVLWAATADGGIEQSGNFDMDIWDDGYTGLDPAEYLQSYYSAGAAVPDMGYNYGRWVNADFEALLDETSTLDQSARQEVFCKMATLLDEELPELLLFTVVNADAHSARLLGVQTSANDLVTWNAADWTLTK